LRRAVLVVVSVAALQVAWSAPAAADPSADPSSAARYYVVGPVKEGQREYLFEIAARTLGDGNRADEILELSKDLAQPGGGRLTDPVQQLQPGWILLLPSDAHGDGVLAGSPPTADASKPPPVSAGRRSNGASTPLLLGGVLLLATVVLVALFRWTLAVRVDAGATRALRGQRFPRRTGATARPVESEVRGRAAEPAKRHRARTRLPAPSPKQTPLPAAGRPPLHPGHVVAELEPLDANPPVRLHLQLVGARGGTADNAYCWLGDETPPPAAIPLILGRQGSWRFFVTRLHPVFTSPARHPCPGWSRSNWPGRRPRRASVSPS
jgi:hypothetical protein